MRVLGILLLGILAAGCASSPRAAVDSPQSMFIVRQTKTTPDDVVAAVNAYAEARKWPYLGVDKVKQGQVLLVKVCIPEVGQQVWPVGLHLSAMLPCGNLGVYQKDGRTEVSLLNPRYMQVLYPDPAIENASATAEPLLVDMLNSVVQ